MSKLLPCPFCERKGEKIEWEETGGHAEQYGCKPCDIFFDTADEWNTRSTAAAIQRVKDACVYYMQTHASPPIVKWVSRGKTPTFSEVNELLNKLIELEGALLEESDDK